MRGPQVFLSHASQDRPFAARLAGTLQRHGVRVWYSATSIRGSQEWQNEIGRALASCRWFVLLGSRAACRKPRGKPWWVQREVIYALGNAHYDGRIIPLLKEKADLASLAWYLPQIQYVDFRKDYHGGFASLLKILGKRYQR